MGEGGMLPQRAIQIQFRQNNTGASPTVRRLGLVMRHQIFTEKGEVIFFDHEPEVPGWERS